MSDIVKTLLETLTEEQKAALIEGLSQTTTEKSVETTETTETTEETVSSNPSSQVNEDFTVSRDLPDHRKSKVKFKKNKWEDMGEDRDESVDYDELSQSRTPRRRGKPSKRNVECHVCGKSFAVNESLIYGEYIRCNKCTGR